ncbi:MAG TPA: hypothetical protein VMK84_02820 [Streptosporangiaceae bacterium]|nr:hypothetical protein [Streptosporangiaceae bacterium]
MGSHASAALAWVHGVIVAVKPAVAAFVSDIGAMASNRPAPAGEVAISMAVLVVLLVFVPRIIKKIAK